MVDDAMKRQIETLDQQSQVRFGKDAWQTSISAMQRAGGVDEATLTKVLKENADPGSLLFNCGKETLLREMQADPSNKDREREYDRIRQAERKAYARYKGRSVE